MSGAGACFALEFRSGISPSLPLNDRFPPQPPRWYMRTPLAKTYVRCFTSFPSGGITSLGPVSCRLSVNSAPPKLWQPQSVFVPAPAGAPAAGVLAVRAAPAGGRVVGERRVRRGPQPHVPVDARRRLLRRQVAVAARPAAVDPCLLHLADRPAADHPV